MPLLAPQQEVSDALKRLADSSEGQVQWSLFGLQEPGAVVSALPQLRLKDRCFIFGASTTALLATGDMIRSCNPTFEAGTGEVTFCIASPETEEEQATVMLGVRVQPLHAGIARMLGLPDGWRTGQMHALEQALNPVLANGQNCAVSLLAKVAGSSEVDATEWIERFLSPSRGSKKLAYLRAEAGKGKTTTLASLVHRRLLLGSGPLPLFIALRDLDRGGGISWPAIAIRLGAIDSNASLLAAAVRAGLVTLVLDGLDEVSGRHNPVVVEQVVSLITAQLVTKNSLVAISGRTTEGAFFDSEEAVEAALELPGVEAESFSRFVELVVGKVSPEWPGVSRKIPEPTLPEAAQDAPAPSLTEMTQATDWICAVFEALGKDRSLFFVQSLACIARSRQLSGNRPLIIRDVVKEIPSTYDVCVLAASLACVREQGKISDVAATLFTPTHQLDLLSLLAVVASADAVERASLPTPNDLIRRVFELDTTHQPEEFSAILHQLQKHALLFSARVDGSTAGEWRPMFLSDWIRGALLARAWLARDRLAPFVGKGLETAIARSERAGLSFRELLSGFEEDLNALLGILLSESNAGSPEATVNYWALMSGLSGAARDNVADAPKELPGFSDFTGATFEGQSFDPRFSGAQTIFNSALFINCVFTGCKISDSEFVDCVFEGCTFKDVDFAAWHGPVHFESCEFTTSIFCNARSRGGPAWLFDDCRFLMGARIIQEELVVKNGFAEACSFSGCESVEDPHLVLSGAGLGFEPPKVVGLQRQTAEAARPPEVLCLRCVLKTFFPSRAGEGGERGARRYIRSTAIGRGALPQGAPSQAELMQILKAEGFTDGGRANHLYAPWSPVVGAGDSAVALRNELNEFMRGVRIGPVAARMTRKIRELAGW